MHRTFNEREKGGSKNLVFVICEWLLKSNLKGPSHLPCPSPCMYIYVTHKIATILYPEWKKLYLFIWLKNSTIYTFAVFYAKSFIHTGYVIQLCELSSKLGVLRLCIRSEPYPKGTRWVGAHRPKWGIWKKGFVNYSHMYR